LVQKSGKILRILKNTLKIRKKESREGLEMLLPLKIAEKSH